jgi:hypothetical protein
VVPSPSPRILSLPRLLCRGTSILLYKGWSGKIILVKRQPSTYEPGALFTKLTYIFVTSFGNFLLQNTNNSVKESTVNVQILVFERPLCVRKWSGNRTISKPEVKTIKVNDRILDMYICVWFLNGPISLDHFVQNIFYV